MTRLQRRLRNKQRNREKMIAERDKARHAERMRVAAKKAIDETLAANPLYGLMNLSLLQKFFDAVPEWEDAVDETACPTGWVTCPFCERGGHRTRPVRAPLRHAPDCLYVHTKAMLEAAIKVALPKREA